jgi:hypothetical protein
VKICVELGRIWVRKLRGHVIWIPVARKRLEKSWAFEQTASVPAGLLHALICILLSIYNVNCKREWLTLSLQPKGVDQAISAVVTTLGAARGTEWNGFDFAYCMLPGYCEIGS